MRLFFAILLLSTVTTLQGQGFGIDLQKEQQLYRATKQVNQFFRRFNAEETPRGDRLYEGDAYYHNADFRRRFLDMLIGSKVDKNLKSSFISDLTRHNDVFLDFHKDGWFAEVKASFNYFGKEESYILFLSIQHELVGSKWVISNVYNRTLYHLFDTDTAVWNKFIHPMSHELDFMNLKKVFDEGNLTPYLKRDFQPDYLSILAYEHKRGNLVFNTIQDVKFHFFQIPGWYFEINNVAQDKEESGWMITRLMQVEGNEGEAYLKLIIRDEDR